MVGLAGCATTPAPIDGVSGSWRTYHADDRNTGHVSDPGPRQGAVEHWRVELDEQVGTPPVVAGDTLYLVGSGKARALSLATGERRWDLTFSETESWDHNLNALALADDSLLHLAPTGSVRCLDVEMESLRWEASDGFHSGPSATAIVGSVALVVNGAVTGYDLTDGTERWRLETEGATGPLVVEDGTVFFTDIDDGVRAIDAETGTERSHYPIDGISSYSGLSLSNGTLYVSTGEIHGPQGGVVAVDVETGDRLWAVHGADRVYSTPTVADDVVYVTDSRENVSAFDARTGELRWSIGLYPWWESHGFFSPNSLDGPIVTGDTLYAIDGESMHALELGTEHDNLADRRRYQIDSSRLWAAPIVVDRFAYLLESRGERLVALGPTA
ncbi:outer membrane protein assembly factor BamB family protein [Halogranum rubrum]|uniref:outer membrane protein assembly factor BamB family protein n=1 Tax=Halogranum rubrum TaxID=553466 RepID=UPI0015A637DB|nr:PQQ-binding-like beta-propeller repeat protein [Halogranum rubrum]